MTGAALREGVAKAGAWQWDDESNRSPTGSAKGARRIYLEQVGVAAWPTFALGTQRGRHCWTVYPVGKPLAGQPVIDR